MKKTTKRLLALIIAVVMAITLFGCGGEEDESTSPSESTEALTEATPDGSDEASTEETQTAAPVPPSTTVNVATGTITGHLTTAFAQEEGDKLISSLIAPTLFVYDRNGRLVTDATGGKTIPYNGRDYEYRTLADVSSEYDAEKDITTYTVRLSSDACFSDGSVMTADDLIFTYYFLCDDSYSGPYSLSNEEIIGIRAYQLNNSQAPFINITSDDVSDALGNPSEELRALVNTQIIRPVIEEGRVFCEENWQRYVERGYGNSPQELFVMLFPTALQSDYTGEGKSFDEVFEETVALFGMNYKAIARIYYGNVEYLDADVNSLVRKYLYETKLATMGGVEVPSIEGISRVDGWTVSIRALGSGDARFKKICDIPVLSLRHYGDAESFDYEAASFGLTRGDVSAVKSHSGTPLGYGPYVFDSIENGAVTLRPNEYYKLGAVPTADLRFINVLTADRVANLQSGNVDLAAFALSTEELDLIKEVNSRSLPGESLGTVLINGPTYDYFGLNKAKLNAGKDGGLYIRQAFATLITACKEEAVSSNLGEAGRVITYPGSSNSWAIPGFNASDGTEGSSSTLAKEYFGVPAGQDRLDAVRKLFGKAGYLFDEEGRVRVGVTIDDKNKERADDAFRSEFTIAIPSYQIDDRAMMVIFEKIQADLSELGFTLSPTYFEQTDEFIISLSAKTFDMWMAERSTASLTPGSYYSGGGRYNYYGYSDDEVNSLIASVEKGEAAAQDVYPVVYDRVMEAAIEVPVYQKQSAFVYSHGRVKVDEDVEFTEFYDMFRDLSVISRVGAE